MTNITKFSQLFTLVRNNNLVSIIDYKKNNGTSRDIHCTLNFETIPKEKLPTSSEKKTMKDRSSRGYIVIFDVDKNDWRTLITKKIKRCIVGNEIYNVNIV